MSSESSPELSSDDTTPQQSRTSSRRQSRTPGSPRKRRRVESVDPSRVRKYYLEGKYNDAYRVLFNEDVSRAAARFEPGEGLQHYTTQYGASTWSGKEQSTLFAALERLGRDDVAGIAQAVGTKSITETRELLLLLSDAAVKQKDAGVTLRDVPAAIEVGPECTEELDVMAEALAWYQEQFDVSEERERYGDYWLITPTIAEDIETALNGPSRAASALPITPAEPGTPRTGPGIAGSCVRCQRHKIRCDRKVPCTNCARMKKEVVCEYRPSKRNNQSVDLTPQTPRAEEAEADTTQPGVATSPQILQAIPQANLLHPENMLALSRGLFMNRSPDIPSPWPHWSAYASEQVPEPSIMRTAFNDFHTLAVSLTKRLMQTAITQATSRLRAQRRRTKKGVMPFVKTRDVLSAIDILGLTRHGRSRWTGVARRCNVRVFDEQRTTRFKVKRREISWDQAEQILGLYDAVAVPPTGHVDGPEPTADTEDGDTFKQRAARSGTPLPFEQLSLYNSDSNIEQDESEEDSDSAMSDNMDDEPTNPAAQHTRDDTDRDTSVEPGHGTRNGVRKAFTLEQFDQEASRQEEETLCNLLGFTSAAKRKSPSDDGSDGEDSDEVEHLTTNPDDWRNWTDYHATWEEYENPVPSAKFADQKPHKMASAVRLDDDFGAPSSAPESPQQARQKNTGVVELRAQNPQAYAAMQSDAFGLDDNTLRSDQSVSDDDLDADVPAQSIENTEVARNTALQDAMDWEA